MTQDTLDSSGDGTAGDAKTPTVGPRLTPRTTPERPAARPPSARLNREILALAIPSFLSTISVPLVGIVDTALVGHLGDVTFMAAVAIGAVLFDTLYWVFGYLRMGTTALVAQAYGAGDDRRAGEILIQTSLIAIAAGVLMILLRTPLTDLGLRLAGGSDEVQHWARIYVLVRIYGAPAVLLTYVLNGFFRGMKDAVTPLIITVLVNGLNVVGDVGLIYGKFGLPRMGVVGAAWASLIAALVGVVVAVAVVIVRYRRPWVAALPGLLRTDGVLNPGRIRRLLTTHTNLFGRTLFLMASYFLMVAMASRLNETALAANAVILHLWHLNAYSVDGVAYASETLVGNALGAGDAELTRRLSHRSMIWGVVLACLYSLVYLIAMRPLAGLFTDDVAVIDAVVGVTLLTAGSQPINAIAFIYDGIFIGANDMPYLFKQMSVSFFLVFLPAVLVVMLVLDGGLIGLWSCMILFMVARAATLHWRFRQPSWIRERLAEARAAAT